MKIIMSPRNQKFIVISLFFLSLITQTKVQGDDLSNWTFGVEIGDTHSYFISRVRSLETDGTLKKEIHLMYSGYFGPATEPAVSFTEGDTLIANITEIINGSLSYQLILLQKDGSNITSSNIPYNQFSDITLPILYHFISTTNITLINYLIETIFQDFHATFSDSLIQFRRTISSVDTDSIYEVDYDNTTGWANRIYAKWWNDTHLIYEYEIVEETLDTTNDSVSWIPLTILIPLILLAIVSKRLLRGVVIQRD